jgi:V/A-type H+/Na+-transporting ATPase subunit A
MELLHRGDEIPQMMQVTGEDGVGLADFVTQRAPLFLDIVCLQQDAFDDVDCACKPERQKALFGMVYAAVTRPYAFKDKTAARNYLTKLTGLYKNLNYAADGSNDFQRIAKAMRSLTDPSRASRPPRTATLPLWARWWRPLERKRELAERSARRGLRCR